MENTCSSIVPDWENVIGVCIAGLLKKVPSAAADGQGMRNGNVGLSLRSEGLIPRRR